MTRTARIGVAFVLLTFYWVLLRTRPAVVLRRARRGVGAALTLSTNHPLLNTLLSAVARAASLHPLRPRCLEQALTASWLLRWAGEDAQVVIGVRQVNGTMDAHAWVDAAGAVNDEMRAAFTEVVQLR
jgi:hypothetical protein